MCFFSRNPFQPLHYGLSRHNRNYRKKKFTKKKKDAATEPSWCCNLQSCDKTGQGLTSPSPTQQRKSNVISRGLNETLNPRRIFCLYFALHPVLSTAYFTRLNLSSSDTHDTANSANRSFFCSNLFFFFYGELRTSNFCCLKRLHKGRLQMHLHSASSCYHLASYGSSWW